jgi:hypothetical protein
VGGTTTHTFLSQNRLARHRNVMSGPWRAIAGRAARDRRDSGVPIDRPAGSATMAVSPTLMSVDWRMIDKKVWHVEPTSCPASPKSGLKTGFSPIPAGR